MVFRWSGDRLSLVVTSPGATMAAGVVWAVVHSRTCSAGGGECFAFVQRSPLLVGRVHVVNHWYLVRSPFCLIEVHRGSATCTSDRLAEDDPIPRFRCIGALESASAMCVVLGCLLTYGMVNWLARFVIVVAPHARATGLGSCVFFLTDYSLPSLPILDYDFAIGGTAPGDPNDGVTAVHLLCKPHRAAAEESKERPAKEAGCCCSIM